jgi:hypothetical protein
MYSRLNSGGAKPQCVMTKDQVEAGNRIDQTTLLGQSQNLLLRLNPNLPTEARLGKGRSKLGWKALNPNNISRDISDPLTYNKKDINQSANDVLKDSDEITVSCRDYTHEQQQKAQHLFATKASLTKEEWVEQLERFVEQTAQSGAAERIEAARNTRGTHSFHVPFRPGSKL